MGFGKSKLIRNVVDYYTIPDIYIGKKILPLPINFKDFFENFDCDPGKLINDKIDGCDVNLRENHSFLILIDGIDEKKLSIDEQIDLLKKLNTFIKDDSRPIKILLTTRYLKGLDETDELDNDLKRYEIRPLSFKKLLEFISAFCSHLNLAKRIIEDLKKSPLFKDLPRSPIAAILLAKLLNENSKEIPSNMTELYAKYVELILGRWDIDKGLQSQKEFEALDKIFTNLSVHMLEYELSSVSLDEVKLFFDSYLNDRNLGISRIQLSSATGLRL